MRGAAPRRGLAAALAGLLALVHGHAATAEDRTRIPGGAATVEPPPLIPSAEWRSPPHALRPLARWWWPGGRRRARATIERAADGRVHAAGFGAVELQPLLLGLGDEEHRGRPAAAQRSVSDGLSRAGWRERRRSRPRASGSDFDFTLGSGWPGGLPTGKARTRSASF